MMPPALKILLKLPLALAVGFALGFRLAKNSPRRGRR